MNDNPGWPARDREHDRARARREKALEMASGFACVRDLHLSDPREPGCRLESRRLREEAPP